MSKRTFFKIRKDILKALNDQKEHSYGDLERRVNTNWRTIRLHCKDLQLFNAIAISKDNKVKITNFGLKILSKL